jgi:hypothetical protein
VDSVPWRIAERWIFPLFLWLLLAPILLYLISSLLVPDQEERQAVANWRNYFFDNHGRMFLLLALIFPIDLIDTLLKGMAHFRAQGPFYVATMVLWTVLCSIVAFTKRQNYHAFIAVFSRLQPDLCRCHGVNRSLAARCANWPVAISSGVRPSPP